ncbi:MAG TPA: cytochrome c [Candidatus Binatia bacterium]|jgi:mono/diheme cytochrome c family protein|nr:cytochrome c [Candidatus Binatia bacterium]
MRQRRGFLAREAAVGMVMLGLAPGVLAAGDAAAGKELYTALCTRCHGDSGRGDGVDGARLATKPRDFTDCARMHAVDDQELMTVIKEGGPALHLSKDMPRWGKDLRDQQIADLVAYIRSFCAH